GTGALAVEGKEIEEGVLLDRPAQCGAELPLVEIELRLLAAVWVLKSGRKALVLVVEVGASVQVVRSRLGHDVDEARRGAAELAVGAVGHDDDLLDRVQVERKGRTLAAALLPEEGIVEVGPVDRDVVLDSLLAVDRQLVAVGALDDRDARSQLGEVEVVVLEV